MPLTKRNRRATVFDNRGEMTTTIPILPPPDANASKRRKRHGTKEGKYHYEPPEYAMIELNGELIAPTQLPDEENRERILGGPDRVELGRLQLGPNEKTPVMILGSHELKGKVEHLKKPLCVMQKKYDEEEGSEKENKGSIPSNRSVQAYQVVGVIKKKLVFNQYPKVIMR